MSGVDLDAIEARARAATPGPWEHNGYFDVYETNSKHGDVVAEAGLITHDAKFIAHARTDVPALVARVRELEAARVGLLSAVDFWANRLGLAPIDVPALVVLLIDESPNGPDDLIWAQHVANELAAAALNGPTP